MRLETIIWTVLLILGAAYLVARAGVTEKGMGKSYVRVEEQAFARVSVPPPPDAPAGAQPSEQWIKIGSAAANELGVTPDQATIRWTTHTPVAPRVFEQAEAAAPGQTAVRLSLRRTVGLWIAALFTLAIFSFAYKDNPFYKVAEAVLVGVSAAYWMVIGFWSTIVPNLIGRIVPGVTKAWALPGLEGKDTVPDFWYLIPLALGIMLLWRLAPKGAWIARWPLAFIIGTTAGIRLVGFIHADFLSQIRASIVPLWVEVQRRAADGTPLVDAAGQPDTGFDIWDSLKNLLLVLGVLACLVYFFFSFEHKGIVGKTARVGIWILMITFGAAFGYTVMGRIALLAIRLEFLFDDWLWLIDPTGKRIAAATSIFM